MSDAPKSIQSAGGTARAKALSPERRSEISRAAVEARWGKKEIERHRGEGWLTIPTQPAPCWIPLGMSEDDFELLEASLRLWRARIVASADDKEKPKEP